MNTGTYTQIYLHFVFVVSHRENLIHEKHQHEIYSFIEGLIKSMRHKTLAVSGIPDHIHIFMGLNPDKSPSEKLN